MAQQTSYPNNPPGAINGLLSGLTQNRVVFTKIASGTVPIGCLCQVATPGMSAPAPLISTPTTGDSGVVTQLATGTATTLLDSDFFGIPHFDGAFMQSTQVTAVGTGSNQFTAYLTQMPVPVMRKGYIWVLTEGAVTQNGNVFARITADGIHQLGQFSGSAAAGVSQFARGRWMMSLSAQGLALMEVW